MRIKKCLFSLVFGGLLLSTGLILTVYLSSTTGAATASTEASGTTGSLKLVIRMNKPIYLTGEMVIVHATLMNTSNASISVIKPGPPVSLFYLLDGNEIVRKLYSTVLTAGPRPSDIVRLTPNNSLSAALDLTMRDITYPISEGQHTLAGHYNTLNIPLEGVWKGEIRTSPLTFTVSPPTGAETNAYQLYKKILSLQSSGGYHENSAQTKAIASDLIARFPQSVYVPCALWKVVPQLLGPRRNDDIVELTEKYFALRRSDDSYLVKGIARFCAEAYSSLGSYRRALDILEGCA